MWAPLMGAPARQYLYSPMNRDANIPSSPAPHDPHDEFFSPSAPLKTPPCRSVPLILVQNAKREQLQRL